MTNTLKHLSGLLDQWVTVKHPDAPHRVWQGRLAEVWDRPSIVLETHGGGRETFPASFDVSPTSEPQPGPAGAPRPWTDLRASGLLWLINRAALHPRGVALAVHTDDRGAFTGWSLITNDEGEPWQFDPATDSDGYERAEATLAAARARLLDCGLCYEENGEEVHPHPECPKSAGPAVIDARTYPMRELDEGTTYPAGALCCVCGGGPIGYDNYLGQLFCWRCADCDCGRDGPCIRTGLHRHQVWDCIGTCRDAFHGRARCERHHNLHPNDGRPGLWHEGTSEDGSTLFWKDGDPGTTPDTGPDTDTDSPDNSRTTPDTDTTAPALTSADTVRTACPDSVPDTVREDDPDTPRTTCPDTGPDTGPDTVRTVWTARVPRRQMGAALAEALTAITRNQEQHRRDDTAAADRMAAEREQKTVSEALARLAPDTAAAAPEEPASTADDLTLGPDGLTDVERERKTIRDAMRAELSQPDEHALWDLTLAVHRALRSMPRHGTGEVATLRDRVGELAEGLADAIASFTVPVLVDGRAHLRTRDIPVAAIEEWRRIHTGRSHPSRTFPTVAGICPTCRRDGLYLGSGGCITCPHADCPSPDAATTVLDDPPSTAHTCNRPDCRDLLTKVLEAERHALVAYQQLRIDVITAAKYIAKQQATAFPFGTGENRWRILTTLPNWIKDPGPLGPPTEAAAS